MIPCWTNRISSCPGGSAEGAAFPKPEPHLLSSLPSSPFSTIYLPAKLQEGFSLPLPNNTFISSLELQIHKVSEKWGLKEGL